MLALSSCQAFEESTIVEALHAVLTACYLEQEEATPSFTLATPTNEQATPTEGQAQPTDEHASPTDEQATPQSSDATPTDGQATPTNRQATPTDCETTPTCTPASDHSQFLSGLLRDIFPSGTRHLKSSAASHGATGARGDGDKGQLSSAGSTHGVNIVRGGVVDHEQLKEAVRNQLRNSRLDCTDVFVSKV